MWVEVRDVGHRSLQIVQNAAARVIACLRKYDHVRSTLRELHWLNLGQRIVFKINVITFKIMKNVAPVLRT